MKKKRKREQFEERKIARRLKEKEKRRVDVERRRAEREVLLPAVSGHDNHQRPRLLSRTIFSFDTAMILVLFQGRAGVAQPGRAAAVSREEEAADERKA